jgi:hypothetical protein
MKMRRADFPVEEKSNPAQAANLWAETPFY